MNQKVFKYFAIILLWLTSLLSASNYYLDPAIGSLANDGSFNSPWNDLKSVLTQKTISDGDTLFLRSGFHGSGFGIIGYHNTSVVIKAQEGHVPYVFQVYILGSNWVLDGILFTPEWNRGHEFYANFENGTLFKYDANSHDNIVQNCEFRSSRNTTNWSVQNWRDSVWSGLKDYGKDNITRHNHFKNVAYGITANFGSEGAVFLNNIVEIYSGDGIRNAGADSTIIEYNQVRNAVELDPDPFTGNHEDGIQGWGDTRGLIIRGNFVYSNTSVDSIPFIAPIQGIVIFDGSTTDAIIENNVVVTEHWHGITLLGAYNTKIINNTVLPVPNVTATQGPPWIRIDKKKDGTASSGNIIRNNLSTDLVVESGSSVVDHNIVSLSASLFCNDYANWDFTPKQDFMLSGKAIIDAGSIIDAPAIDIEGNIRPQGNGIDIGAYESPYWLYPLPDNLLTTFEQDFNSDVDTSFWANNWATGKIIGDRDGESFKYITDSLDNYFLGIVLDFQNSKSLFINLRENPYVSFKAKVNGNPTIDGTVVDSIPIGLDLINPQGNNIGFFYLKDIIAANGEWQECFYDFSEIAQIAGMDSVAMIRFNPGKERFDGFVSYSGSVSIDDFKLGEAAFVPIDTGEPILFKSIPKLTDKFYSTWKVTPTHQPMDGVTGFSKGEVSTFSNMGILVRFKDNKVDAYNGSGYEAENELIFEAGKEYTIKVIADIKAQTYSVDVTPEGSDKPVRIGTDFLFRTVNPQDTLNYFAMVINELESWGGIPGSRLNPSFMEDNYELNFVSNNAIIPQKKYFSMTFNITPTAQRLNSAIALLKGEAIMNGWEELSIILRLNNQNKFDVRNDGEYKADIDLEYIAGVTYSVTMNVNIPMQTYSVFITPEGS